MQQNGSKSFDANQKSVSVCFSCTNCSSGTVARHQNYSKAPLSHQHSYESPNSMSMPWRKKSLCLNNPPLPMPMQPVRESSSRSPSPQRSPHHNTSQTSTAHNKLNGVQQEKRQSAPVNVPKNRCRTMSTGSTGSFSASSSFSSSVGGASFSIGSPLNQGICGVGGGGGGGGGTAMWKKNTNQHSSHMNNNSNTSHINHHSSSMHSSSSNLNGHIANTASSNQEANNKSDAECLNNMLATMTVKLNLTDTASLEEKLASTGNIFYRYVRNRDFIIGGKN